MRKTKLISLLKTFTRQEAGRFREFVHSPFFNKNESVMKLADGILKCFPDFASERFTEQHLFVSVFPNEEYDYFKFRNVWSDLFQLALLFIKHLSFEKNEIDIEIGLLNELHERRLDKLFEQARKRTGKKLESIVAKDEEYQRLLYKFFQVLTKEIKFKGSSYTFDLIQEEFDAFLRYAVMSLLRHYSKMLTNRNHGNVDFRLEMFDEVWEYVKRQDLSGNPQSLVYRQIIALELGRKEKDYVVLKGMKHKYEEVLSREDKYYILTTCNSFITSKLKEGDDKYYRDRFAIFREMVENGFITADYILFMNFISFFTSACTVGEYDWANDFMNRFSDGISPLGEKANTINYCRGYFEYCHGRFDNAVGYFSKTRFRLFLAKVMVRSYTLRCLYELGLNEQTISGIESFRKYLRSENLIAEQQKEAHYEFLKHLSVMTGIAISKTSDRQLKVQVTALGKEIKAMQGNPLAAKRWLLQKLELLTIRSAKNGS